MGWPTYGYRASGSIKVWNLSINMTMQQNAGTSVA